LSVYFFELFVFCVFFWIFVRFFGTVFFIVCHVMYMCVVYVFFLFLMFVVVFWCLCVIFVVLWGCFCGLICERRLFCGCFSMFYEVKLVELLLLGFYWRFCFNYSSFLVILCLWVEELLSNSHITEV